jgi:hypothetical protein
MRSAWRVCALAALAGILAGAPAATLPRPDPGGPIAVVAVGDIACDPGDSRFNGGAGTATACRQRATSDLALALRPEAALLLGDLQYWDGALAKFQAVFDPTWGRLKAISHPAVGNHEYGTAGAGGYFGYFGAAAGPAGKGWYSFDLGGWHLVALNANCAAAGGCGPGSPQLSWLAADLAAQAATAKACTLAFWHHPRFSSSAHGSDAAYASFWETLQSANADLVLVGHDHVYERFAPQDAAGVADPVTGIRELVVGTGGRDVYAFNAPQPNSEVRLSTFGVLSLALHSNGYRFGFVPLDGGPGDAGAGFCHRAWQGPPPAFHPLPGCRIVNTRWPAGPTGGPVLSGAGVGRDFPLRGSCGVPAGAVAVAVHVLASHATTRGRLLLYPTGEAPPAERTLAIRPGSLTETDLLLPLGVGGAVRAEATLADRGHLQLRLDVSGYFQ